MQNRFQDIDELIQDFIDDRLNDHDRTIVIAYLSENPELRAEVEEMCKLNDTLENIGRDVLDEKVPDKMKKLLDDARRGKQLKQSD